MIKKQNFCKALEETDFILDYKISSTVDAIWVWDKIVETLFFDFKMNKSKRKMSFCVEKDNFENEVLICMISEQIKKYFSFYQIVSFQ